MTDFAVTVTHYLTPATHDILEIRITKALYKEVP